MIEYILDSEAFFTLPVFKNAVFKNEDPLYLPIAYILHHIGKKSYFESIMGSSFVLGKNIQEARNASSCSWASFKTPLLFKCLLKDLLCKFHNREQAQGSSEEQEDSIDLETNEISEVSFKGLCKLIMDRIDEESLPDEDSLHSLLAKSYEKNGSEKTSGYYLEGLDISKYTNEGSNDLLTSSPSKLKKIDPKVELENVKSELESLQHAYKDLANLMVLERLRCYVRGFRDHSIYKSPGDLEKTYTSFFEENGGGQTIKDLIAMDEGVEEKDLFVKEVATEQANKQCIICRSSDACMVVNPCMHLILCEKCADMILQGGKKKCICPLCKGKIKKCQRVYT